MCNDNDIGTSAPQVSGKTLRLGTTRSGITNIRCCGRGLILNRRHCQLPFLELNITHVGVSVFRLTLYTQEY